MGEDLWEHQREMAAIEARKEAFERSPFWFSVWYLGVKFIQVVFWVAFWALVAQCTCNGCIYNLDFTLEPRKESE